MDQAQQTLRGEWIRALLDTGGIADDLLRKCSPKEFYKLVPGIFKQILMAYAAGILPLDKLQNGVERKISSRWPWLS